MMNMSLPTVRVSLIVRLASSPGAFHAVHGLLALLLGGSRAIGRDICMLRSFATQA
jgi:hypothetical protein